MASRTVVILAWCHCMDTYSTLTILYFRKPPFTIGFQAQSPVKQSFDSSSPVRPAKPRDVTLMSHRLGCVHFGLILSDINSLWPNDTIWRHASGSTLAPVMACCLTAPSHYLNHCWLIISKDPWNWSEVIMVRNSEDTTTTASLKSHPVSQGTMSLFHNFTLMTQWGFLWSASDFTVLLRYVILFVKAFSSECNVKAILIT